MRLTIPCVFAVVLFSTATSAQQQPPRFAGGIDLLTVQATVISKDGRPVGDLQPGDFEVTVEGKPRRVLFARFYAADVSGATTSTIGAPGTPITVAPADNSSRQPGRIVVFVVDRESIRSGTEAALLDAAGSVIATLGAADASGALALPDSSVSLMRDHPQVRDALRRMTGAMPPDAYRWVISWQEALDIERSGASPGWGAQRKGDNRVLQDVYARECREAAPPRISGGAPTVAEGCDNGVIIQALDMLRTARTHARAVLASLGNLAKGFEPLRGPKHLVFLSGGLWFDQTLIAEFDAAARAANAAGISLHAIHLEQPVSDATTERRSTTDPFGGRDMATGLTTMAGMTGGSFFYGVGRATGVFDRIATEVANFYELGLETTPADADGQPRSVEVKVDRAGVAVRARRQVSLSGATHSSAQGASAVVELLRQPTEIADLRIALGAYTTRGDEADLLKVLLSAEIDAPQARGPIAWGYIVTTEGNVVANGRQVRDEAKHPWTITTSAKLAPGAYRVRFAAVDADGRAGLLDVPLVVGMHVAGPIQASDLIIGTVDGERLQPGTRVVQGADGAVLVELWSSDPEQLAKTGAVLEIFPGGSAEPVQRFRMALRSSASGPGLVAEGHFRTAALPPGRYTASVAPVIDDKPLARIIRVFEVVAASR